MISYQKLATLRLRDLLKPALEIVERDGWEWMGHAWWYEGIGFTWFGRLAQEPSKTVAFELSLTELSAEQLATLSKALALPIRHGMSLPELANLLGQPVSSRRFVADRRTHVFSVSSDSPYVVSATIQQDSGLIHISAIPAALVGDT